MERIVSRTHFAIVKGKRQVMKALYALWSSIVLLFLTSASHAQSFYGAGGLLIHPTALTSEKKGIALYASWATQKAGSRRTEWQLTTLAFDISDRLSAGLVSIYHRGAGAQPHEHVHPGIFAKYQLLPDSPSHPAFALAASYRDKDELQTTLAAVLSHRFARQEKTLFNGHLGAKYGRTPSGRDGVAGFVGLDIPLGKDFHLFGEVATRLSFEPREASAVGLLWAPTDGLKVVIGMINIGRSDSNRFFIGVGYPIGGAK